MFFFSLFSLLHPLDFFLLSWFGGNGGRDRVLLFSLGCPGTYYVVLTGLKLVILLTQFPMLVLEVLATVCAALNSFLCDRLFKHPFTPFHTYRPVAIENYRSLREFFIFIFA